MLSSTDWFLPSTESYNNNYMKWSLKDVYFELNVKNNTDLLVLIVYDLILFWSAFPFNIHSSK